MLRHSGTRLANILSRGVRYFHTRNRRAAAMDEGKHANDNTEETETETKNKKEDGESGETGTGSAEKEAVDLTKGHESDEAEEEMPKKARKPQTRIGMIQAERAKYLAMPVEEKRKSYKCRQYCTIEDVPSWAELYSSHRKEFMKKRKGKPLNLYFPVNKELCEKVSIWRGDITTLEIDAIGNAANSSLLGGGGVDGAIHNAAGSKLRAECATLNGCDTGQAKITAGYKIPAKYIIHTVGPIGENAEKLRSCYKNCLALVKKENLRHMAFPCISTGIYGYPNDSAAHIALKTVREWLEKSENAKRTERIIFCLFLPVDVQIYQDLMQQYFPMEDGGSKGDTKTDAANSEEEKPEEVTEESSEKDDESQPKSYLPEDNEKMDISDEKVESENESTAKENNEDKDKNAEEKTDANTDSKDVEESVKGTASL